MKYGLKVLYWLFYACCALAILGGAFGIFYELLPDRSFIPDSLFSVVFFSQFVIIPGLFLTGFLIRKIEK
ncbi:MAG: hypothetical protein IJX47_00750 [Clostridia bacterium]|nr:hypothetical protein [Clostridia bacterium]